MPAKGLVAEQRIVNSEQAAKQRPEIRIYRKHNVSCYERPYAFGEGCGKVTEGLDERIIQNLLQVIGSEVIPQRVYRRNYRKQNWNHRKHICPAKRSAWDAFGFRNGLLRNILCDNTDAAGRLSGRARISRLRFFGHFS